MFSVKYPSHAYTRPVLYMNSAQRSGSKARGVTFSQGDGKGSKGLLSSFSVHYLLMTRYQHVEGLVISLTVPLPHPSAYYSNTCLPRTVL